MQLVADGLFHVLMHAVLAAGLVLLYKARQDLRWTGQTATCWPPR